MTNPSSRPRRPSPSPGHSRSRTASQSNSPLMQPSNLDSKSVETRRSGTKEVNEAGQHRSSSNGGNEPRTHFYYGYRSRNELLATRVMSVEDLVESMKVYGPNGAMHLHPRILLPIAIVLRPGESEEKYELNFQRWLAGRDVTLKTLEKDPEEERRYRQCFAYVRVAATTQFHSRGRSRSRSRDRHSRKRSSIRDSTPDNNLKRPRIEPAEEKTNSTLETKPSDTDSLTERIQPLMIRLENLVTYRLQDIKRNLKSLDKQDQAGNGGDNGTQSSQPDADTASHEVKEEQSNATIFYAASEILKTADQVSVDLTRKSLVDDYTRICDQIALNETAMDDALAYLKAITTLDETQATEQLHEIKELTVLINKEKRRRDAALAAVVAHEWTGRGGELLRTVQQFVRAGKSKASHDRLLSVFVKLQQKREEMLAVQVKLKNRLSWLKAEDTGREEQFQELRELTSKLVSVLTVLARMEGHRQTLSMDLLQANESIRMETISLIKEARYVVPRATQ